MSSKKTHDLVLVVGEYTDAQGTRKKRYRTIGALMDGEHGPFVTLHAEALSMQLFALANRERRDSVLLGAFSVDRERGAPQAGVEAIDDDIPY